MYSRAPVNKFSTLAFTTWNILYDTGKQSKQNILNLKFLTLSPFKKKQNVIDDPADEHAVEKTGKTVFPLQRWQFGKNLFEN